MLRSLLLISLLVSTSVFAQKVDLDNEILSQPELQSLIGQMPKTGSAEEAQDFKVLLQVQQFRTAQDCAIAAKEADTSIETMFGGDQKILTDAEVSKMKTFLFKAYVNVGLNIYRAKNLFKRPRPYVTNPNIKPCIALESSYAYPSGHTMMVRLYARILSKVFPEREQLFLQRATQYSLNRVIGGVHHPSDIAAGNVVADYLAGKMIEKEGFMKAMDSL